MPQLERQHRKQSLVQFLLALVLLILINILAGARLGDTPLYGALDLTEDKRFTLTDNTVNQLEALEEPLFVRVLLDGDLPLNYARLRDKVEESLTDFAGYTDNIEWEFSDPLAGGDQKAIQDRQRQLQEDLNVLPVSVFSSQSAAERSLNAVYPYAILYYGQRVTVVRFFESNLPDVSEERRINQAEALLEYNFSKAIRAITNNDKGLIGYTVGHGELPPIRVSDLSSKLAADYEVGPVNLDSFATLPQDIQLLIVAKPTRKFDDFDAFKLDQYVMNGGKVLWAIDAVGMDYDSLRGRNEFYPQPRETGLDDLLFRYGVRLGPVLALDLMNTRIGIVTSQGQAGPKISMVPFPYHVKAIPDSDHPIVKNLDPIDLRFPTVIESVNDDPEVKKTVLLSSSDRARRQRLPSPVDLDAQKYSMDLDRFNENDLPFAYLLEGSFTSPYANRLSREDAQVLQDQGMEFKGKSVPTRMLVISDGDVLANPVKNGNVVMPTGNNIWEKFTYANGAFMLNAIEYLLNPDGVIDARGKDVKLRLLDKEAALAEATKWRVVNIVLPLVLLGVFGVVFNWMRRRKYAKV